ncbi:MAG: NAD(P)/FAD-dependent oxidoreductase [Filifactoraceae bacterium]
MIYDLIIIGAGAAGIMGALEASKKGLNVCLVEQNSSIGKKLAITGGGRCNLTSAIPVYDFEKYIPRNYNFLKSSFAQFDNNDLINYIFEVGLNIQKEKDKIYLKAANGKLFVEILELKLKERNVIIKLNTKVIDLIFKETELIYIKTNKGILKGRDYLITSGGLSYPDLGSDGSIMDILTLKNIFKLEETYPSLVPIKLKNNIFSELAGVTITAGIILEINKRNKRFVGDLLFTHKGISGPIVLNLSSYIVDLDIGRYNLYLDLLPEIETENLYKQLKKVRGKAKISESLNCSLPKNLIKKLFQENIIDFSNLKNKNLEEIILSIKKFKIEIDSFEGYNKAIVTRGGISVKEIDPKTMKSKKIDNLYFAGEVIDVDGLTGGYNLQIAFSTGYIAAKNIGGNRK